MEDARDPDSHSSAAFAAPPAASQSAGYHWQAIGQARVIDGDTHDIGSMGRIVMKRVIRAVVVLPEG